MALEAGGVLSLDLDSARSLKSFNEIVTAGIMRYTVMRIIPIERNDSDRTSIRRFLIRLALACFDGSLAALERCVRPQYTQRE